MTNVYRCKRLGKHAPEEVSLANAKALFDCINCIEAKLSRKKCYGPKMLDDETPSTKPVTKHPAKTEIRKVKTPAPKVELVAAPGSDDIPEITPEIDEAIRRALAEISVRFPYRGMAGLLVKRYGEEIRAARSKKCGWKPIVKLFRSHGLHVTEKSLRNAIENE